MTNEPRSIKCVVWDLDNTIWDGILLEDEHVTLRDNVESSIKALDHRGILHSIASKNDHNTAIQKLDELGLGDYFLNPQINWNSKVESIKKIAQSINIGIDSIALIDDDPFERDEVKFSLPDVLCIDAAEVRELESMPIMNPKYVTEDSRLRRQMYISDIARNEVEERYEGPKESFLASLGMVLEIFPAQEEDLQRAEELTVRTHQLNATGVTYSYDELNHFRQSEEYLLLMTRLKDKYGSYGHIGLALIERGKTLWIIKLLLMSCRVMSRGIGSIMITHIINLAREHNAGLQAHFVPNDRNRMMNITFRFAGFYEANRDGNLVILQHDPTRIPKLPEHVNLVLK